MTPPVAGLLLDTAYPLAARDALFRLFDRALRTPEAASVLDWLELAAEEGGASALAERGRARGLERVGLDRLLGAAEFDVLLGPGEDRPRRRAYLLDRLPRLRRVLAGILSSPETDELRRAVRLGQELFNEGLFFECHECLEGAWRGAQGRPKRLLQGLIQLGAALHKLELDPSAAAAAAGSVSRALAKLEAERSVIGAGEEALGAVREIRRRLASGRADLGRLPELRLLR